MATENPTTPVDGETREALYRTVNQFMDLFNFALAIRALIRDISGAGGSDSAAAAQGMCTQMAEAARKFSTEADEAWLASRGGDDYQSGAKAALAALHEGTQATLPTLRPGNSPGA